MRGSIIAAGGELGEDSIEFDELAELALVFDPLEPNSPPFVASESRRFVAFGIGIQSPEFIDGASPADWTGGVRAGS